MDKKLQDLAWSILPKEFKEEVKNTYFRAQSNGNREAMYFIAYLFGDHNLTSDAEVEEEILTANKKDVQEQYALQIAALRKGNLSDIEVEYRVKLKDMLEYLFGSKCLPDNVATSEPNVDSSVGSVESLEPKPAEPKFKVGDYARYKGDVHKVVATTKDNRCYLNKILGSIDESDLEPYTEPTFTDDCQSQSKSRNLSQETANCDKHFDNILKDSFSKERRLNIAAMIMAAMMQNAKWGDKYSHIATISRAAADALIAEVEKGNSDGED